MLRPLLLNRSILFPLVRGSTSISPITIFCNDVLSNSTAHEGELSA